MGKVKFVEDSLQKTWNDVVYLTLPWRRSLSYRNQSIDLQNKPMDWFLYDKYVRHERVKQTTSFQIC